MTVITALAIMGSFSIPKVSAHSEAGPQGWFSSGTQSICYATTGLGYLKLDGSTGQGSAVKTQVQKGQSEVSNNTDMNLSETTSCSGYKSWVTSFYDPSTSLFARTSPLYTSSGIEYKIMEYNNNQYLYWVTNGNCSPISADLSNVANHEFGHYAGMDHQTDGASDHTMMHELCDSYYSSIKTADITFVNNHY